MRHLKIALAVALVLMAIVGLALPAGAHVTSFRNEVVLIFCLDPSCDTFDVDSVSGDITCTAGEVFLVKVRVEQRPGGGPGYIGRGNDKGKCTGSEQSWTAEIGREEGFAVCDEPFKIASFTQGFVAGQPHGNKANDTDTDTVPCSFGP